MRRRSSALRSTKYCRATSLATSSRAPSTPGRCGRRIGLRRVARRPHATGQVDLPGHVDTGAQRTRVGHALLDRGGQPLSLREADACTAHRGPQTRCLGIASRASLGDARSAIATSWFAVKASSTSAVNVASP
jgi:hypothetical protein